MAQDFGPPCIVTANGKHWLRPNSTCYSCDLKGPACLWHGKDWREVTEDEAMELLTESPSRPEPPGDSPT